VKQTKSQSWRTITK